MRKKWEFVIYVFLSWIILTSVFYAHHTTVVKTMTNPGWDINSRENILQVKEIRIFNKRIHTLGGNSIVNFYKWSDGLKDDDKANGWYMEISCGYLMTDLKETSGMPEVNVIIDDRQVRVTVSNLKETGKAGKGIGFFTARIEHVNPRVKNIVVKWKRHGEEQEVILQGKFVTTYYSFFDRKPGGI